MRFDLVLPDYDVFFRSALATLGGDLGVSSAGLTLHSRCQTREAEAWREFCDFLSIARCPPEPPGGWAGDTPRGREDGGARRDRTDDLMLAKHALYQLSYDP